MKNLTLVKKMGLLGIVFLVVVIAAISVLSVTTSHVDESTEQLRTREIAILNKSHAIKLSVVQVQQWLTDISATRGLDGLNDGFDEAEKNAQLFRKLIKEVSSLDPENAARYQAILPVFEDYYAVGQQMAKAYVAQGPAGGNAMMGRFDEVAAAIAEQVDKLLADAQQRAEAMLNQQGRQLNELEISIISAMVLLLLVMGLIFWFMNGAVKMLPRLIESMERISTGHLNLEYPSKKRGDEIGQLCEGLETMQNMLKELIGGIMSGAQQLTSASTQLAAVTQHSQVSIDQQQNEINQVATAMAEMTASSQEVANHASLAAESAREADNQAKQGSQVVNQSVSGINVLAANVSEASQAIDQLKSDSESIGGILDVIRGIADQTNLLALNAAIEAARAGEQGRGFAVVADEVRTLAQRTQSSTQEIQEMIEQLQSGAINAVKVMELGKAQTDESVNHATMAGSSLSAITSAVGQISDMNLQIAAAAEEQSQVAEDMSRNITGINMATEQSAESARQIAHASEELTTLANQLQQSVARFKV